MQSGQALANYATVRTRVLAMLDSPQMREARPSRYWQEELDGLDYLFDATPAIVNKLRHHCHHITGVKAYDYRSHHAWAAPPFRAKLAALRAVDDVGLFVPESPMLGGFGHDIDGQLVNIDTLKFYESMIALSRAGFLPPRDRSHTVVEIGAGWGGFAHVMKTLFPRVAYIVVDLPHAILFSATYLKTAFPDAKVFIHGDEAAGDLSAYDFVFVPHYAFATAQLPKPDLGINMVSFQEMTQSQVTGYFERLSALGCARFYSHNRERSPHNTELNRVSEIFSRFYDVRDVEVLPTQYTDLAPAPTWAGLLPRTANPKRFVFDLGRNAARMAQHLRGEPLGYRHLAGTHAVKSV